MTATHTRTHAVRVPANPYLVCSECGAKVDAWPEPLGAPLVNLPCGHHADYDNLCPSWGPVDGCRCDPPGHPDVLPDNTNAAVALPIYKPTS